MLTFGIMMYTECHCAECQYPECCAAIRDGGSEALPLIRSNLTPQKLKFLAKEKHSSLLLLRLTYMRKSFIACSLSNTFKNLVSSLNLSKNFQVQNFSILAKKKFTCLFILHSFIHSGVCLSKLRLFHKNFDYF